MINATFYNVAALRCASLCVEREDCLMYSVNRQQCILTNHKVGTVETFDDDETWYIRF